MVKTKRAVRRAGAAALVAGAVAIPFLFGPYMVSQFTLVLVYAIAALGLNLLVGYAGQLSLGHGAFVALGAYTCAILLDRTELPHVLMPPVAGVLAFIGGVALGLPALRVRGHYLGLVTLSLAIATPVLLTRFDGVTGGVNGISVALPRPPAWTGLASDQFVYLWVVAIGLPLLAFATGIVRRDTGRALLAIRDHETAARAMGVDLARWKTLAFGVSASYCGIAGALLVFSTGFVAPESFTLLLSFSLLAAIVVGGLATIGGALLGALFIVFVPVYASDVNQALSGVVYGAALMLCMYVLRGGLMGLLRTGTTRLLDAGPARRRGREDDGT